MSDLGAVYIPILPRVDNEFERTIERQTRGGLRTLERNIDRSVQRSSASFDRLGQQIDDIFDGANIGTGLTDGFEDAIRDAIRDTTRIAQEGGRDIADALDGRTPGGQPVGAGLLDALDDATAGVERELRQAVTGINDELDSIGVGTDLAQRFRRAGEDAAAGLVDGFDGSGRRIATTIDREIGQLNTRVDIPVTADTGDLRSELGQISDQDITFTVDSTGVAQVRSDVADLERNRTFRLDADADLSQVRGDIDQATRNRTIEVDADVSGARNEIEGLFDGIDFGNIGSSLSGAIGGALSAAGPGGAAVGAAGVGLAALFGSSFFAGVEREAQGDQLTARLGLTGPEAQRALDAAGNLFADAYGESFAEVSSVVGDAVALNIPDLERLTGVALSMQSAFDGAAGEYLQLADQLRVQGVTDSVEESLDFLTTSFQRLPSNLVDPLSEAVREYGVFLADLGFDTDEIFSSLVAAAQRGEFELDKFGDAIKEFGIRATDDSSATIEAFNQIGIAGEQYEALTDSILAGGTAARGAFDEIVDGLLSIEDAQTRANAAIALFGTPLEDLSVQDIDEFLVGLQNLEGGFQDVAGAATTLDEQINDNLQVALTTYQRQWSEALTNVGQGLIESIQTGDNAQLEQAAEDLGILAGEAILGGMTAALSGGAQAVTRGFIQGLTPEFEVAGVDAGVGLVAAVEGVLTGQLPTELIGAEVYGNRVAARIVDSMTPAIQDALGDIFSNAAGFVDNVADRPLPLSFQLDIINDARQFSVDQFNEGIIDLDGLAAALQEYARQRDELFAPFDDAESIRFQRIATELEEVEAAAGPAVVAIQEFGEAGERSTEQLEALDMAVSGLFDFTGEFALAQAAELTEGFGAALAEIGPAAVDAAGNINLAEQSGRDLLDALAPASAAISDLFSSDLQPEQINAALGAVRDSLRDALRDAEFTDAQIETILQTFVDADGRVIELGMRLDSLAFDTTLDEAIARGQGADGLVFEPGLDIGTESYYVALQQAEADGAAFEEDPFTALLAADPEPLEVAVAAGIVRGLEFAGLSFEPDLGANPGLFEAILAEKRAEGDEFAARNIDPDITANSGPFDRELAAAEASRRVFDAASATIDLFANDRASGTINNIARRRTAIIDVSVGRLPTLSISGGRILGYDGLIVDRAGVPHLADGAILNNQDGIIRPRPGGVDALIGDLPVVLAENGAEELAVNAASSDRRKLDLLRSFDGGSLIRLIRDDVAAQATSAIQRVPLQNGGIIDPATGGGSTGLLQRIAAATEAGAGTAPGGVTNIFIERVDVADGDSFADELALMGAQL